MRNFYAVPFLIRMSLWVCTFLLITQAIYAQTPQFYKGLGTSTNTIPMNTAGSHTQQIYLPADFDKLPTSGNITKIYFRNSVAGGTGTYTNFSVSFLQNSLSAFANSTFLTGATNALTAASITINGNATAGGWYVIPLTTPFKYDNTKTLIVEIKYTAKTGGMSGYVTTAGGNKRLSIITAPGAATGNLSTLWGDFGMDIIPGTACSGMPVAGTVAVTPGTAVCGNAPITLNLTGNSSAAGIAYQWQTSATSAGTYSALGSSLESPYLITTAPVGTRYYRCMVTCATDTAYTTPVAITGAPPLPAGNYTINSTLAASATNFTSFGAAVAAISCGIAGPVVFDVTTTSAVYNEQVIIPQIMGTSTTNTVTFNGNGNILSYTSTNTNERAVLKLNDADHIKFDSLTIRATGTATTEYGYGIQLINNADSNTFSRINIEGNLTGTTSNYAGVVISASATSPTTTGATLCDGNLFTNNTIVGGYYGMTMVGGSGNLIAGNRFINNIIKDFYTYGIYASYTDKALIEGNSISRPDRVTTSTFYGIQLGTASQDTRISKNRIFNPKGGDNNATSVLYGIYVSGADGTAAAPNIISNNLLYEFNGAGSIYALYNTSSPYSRYYHNTISLDNAANSSTALTRGFYQSTEAAGVELRNNIISITRSGGGTNAAIYLTASNLLLSDYNNLYVTPGGANSVGYLSGAQNTITDWQSAALQDANSISVDPQFNAPATGNLEPVNANAWNNLGEPVGITSDINGALRSDVVPDLGAYENAIVVCTTPPIAGKILGATQACVGTPFSIFLRNGSSGTGQTYQWQSSPDKINFTNISGANGVKFTTTQTADSLFYRCVVTCGTASYSDTVELRATLCYCTSVPTSTGDTEIFGVTLNGVTNSSDCATVAPGAGSILARYSNFHPRGPLTAVTQGETVSFSVIHEDCTPATYYAAACAIWIDYNKDGDFDDVGEKVFVEDALTIGPRTISGTFTVPVTAKAGITGMRVILAEGAANIGDGLKPCMTYTFGETEDYVIRIKETVPCNGTPVAGVARSSKNFVCPSENFELSVSGTTVATGLTYQWQSSADNSNWTNMTGGGTTERFTTSQLATSYYRYIITCTNGGSNATSTSIKITSPGIVSGNFTINSGSPTAGNNFQSFNDAYDYIKCGINGPVVFDVAAGSGPYNEQLIMSQVPGASAINTITFNGNGATIVYRSNNTNERAVIKLNGTDHVILDSLVISATGTSASEYGFGIQLLNNADSNTVKRSTININTSATSSNYAGVVISATAISATSSGATSLSDGNVFDKNTITGGYYGMTMVGGTGNTISNKFINNTIRDFYYYGIYAAYTSASLFEANSISRPNRSTISLFNGIYLTSGNERDTIVRNKIFNTMGGNPASTSAQYGINFASTDATAANPVIVANNVLYNFNGAGIIYGLFNTGSDNVSYYHNTISLDNSNNTTDAVTRGFYQTTLATGIAFKNNIVTVLRGGGGTNHAVYFNTATSTIAADYNNYFLADSSTNFVGYAAATNYQDMVDWQTATTYDKNSVVFNPEYLDLSFGDLKPMSNLLDNLGTPVSIASDINKAARSITTPDMGAYEYLAVACVNPPVPGTVVSTLNPACLNVPFTLSINGGAAGYGQTYQWQSSTNNTDWSNIPNATGRSLTTQQSVTTYYRVVYTCGVGVPSASLMLTTPPLVSGRFTINKGQATGNGNFQSFNDAYNYLRCGINGAVIFDVEPNSGVYNEQLIMEYVAGTSATNTITFNGNNNTIRFASINSEERAVIKLRGARHVIFDSLIIDARAGDFGYGVQLTNNTDSNTVKRCTIHASQADATEDHAGIVISGSESTATAVGLVLSDDNNFENNKINGGYYGITLAATFTNGANGRNRFKGNDVRDFYATGIYVAGSYGTIIDSNSFSRPNRADVGEFKGVFFTTQKNTGCIVSRNRIHNAFDEASASTNAFYGIFFSSSDGSTGGAVYNENIVSNNLIYGVNGEGAAYGIANTGSDYAQYYHNTIALDNVAATSAALSRGFYQTTAAAGIIFANNIVAITTGGTGSKHCVYFNTNLPLAMDFNDYYINAAGGTNNIGYYTADRLRLADWTLALGNGMDQFSVSTIPSFINPATGNYTPGNAGLNNKGAFVGVTNDILNRVRDANTPDMGAYEFTPSPCSVPPVNGRAQVSPASLCQNKPVYLSMDISAYGSGQTFQWQTAKTLAGPFTNLGNPMMTADTTIQSASTLYFRVAASCGAATVYSDTIQLVVNPALPGGTYTINKGAATNYVPGTPGGNFNSFGDAKAAMGCGITGGPVVFNVAVNSGTYTEKLLLDSIPGASAVNTITFNGNGNKITANSTVTGDRSVITLNGADHIIFDSLVIDAGTGTYGYGVQLINNADSNTFRRNTILASTTGTTTNFAGVVINATAAGPTSTGATLCDDNLFERNTITGGNVGISLVGSTTVATFLNANRFIGNKILDFYSYGMYIAGTVNTLIEGNTFARPARAGSATSLYGIYLTAAESNRLHITKNRFTNFLGGAPASTSISYAVYHNQEDASAGNEDTVSNNLIYGFSGNAPVYGFYNNNANNVFYYHNTISFDNAISTATGVTVGFYQTGAATGLQFKNNIVTITRGGTGTKHGIYRGTNTSEIEADRNNYYLTGSATYVGYANGNNLKSVAELAAVTNQDKNSVSHNPLYTDSVAGNFKPQLALIDNIGMPLPIGTDITNLARSTTTPDIGAYEYSPAVCASPLVAGTAAIVPASGVCLEKPIRLNITGHSPLGSITFQWEASPNGTSNWLPISGVQYYPQFDTVTTVNNYYRAKVVCGGTPIYTNVVNLTLNSFLPAGTYTIDNSAPVTYVPGVAGGNFQSFGKAVEAMLCGIGGKVVFNVLPGTNGVYNEQVSIPYIPGTSAASTVTFQSSNGVAAAVNLSYAATTTDNYTLRLDSAKNFIFKNLTFTAQHATNGRAIVLTKGASADSILNNIISVPAVTAASNTVVGIYVNEDKGSGLVMKGNKISNGSNGIYFSGTSATVLGGLRHVIDGNQVTGSYSNGVHVAYANRIAIINNAVELSGALEANAAGIYTNTADSSSKLSGNLVTISGVTSTPVIGIHVSNTRAAIATDSTVVAGNRVVAAAGNAGTVIGLTITGSKGVHVLNNVIAINSAGATAYGLYNRLNAGEVNYYNNTVNITAASPDGYPGYFEQTTATSINVKNNIFSNKGGGKALFVDNPALYSADYNMLHASGANLVGVTEGTTTNFTSLAQWKNTWNWDASSIRYEPAFADNLALRPDLNNPNVWAMHGRGVQIKGNNYDFNNQPRVEERTKGVPDLGAYEFFPTAQPAVLLATPAAPAPNTTQVFSFGTDTVMRINWQANAPATVSVKRFSGVVPSGLPTGADSMFFYTQVEVPGTNDYRYNAQLYYVDSWQGSIPSQSRLGLGRTTPSNAWIVGATSRVDIRKKEISLDALVYLDKFTGLVNEFAQPQSEDSSSNRGKDFWVGYQRTNGFTGANGGAQTMKIYMGASDVPANVTITIEGGSGTPWVRNYFVAANTAITSEDIPKANAEDARLENEGMYAKRGIHITSDVPIVAYAHIFESANSGATMLMPTAVWGYEYYTLSSRQYYGTTSYSAFHIVAQHDNTWVEINPSKPTRGGWVRNGGTQSNGSYLVKLNKGDAYQVLGANLSGSEGHDLTGSYVKSIGNDQGQCYPIGVFAGSTRTAINCGTSPTGSGDLIIQQIFPYQAWGTKYATAPTSMIAGPSATTRMSNIYRVMVKDPATVVKRNNVALPVAALIDNKYYQFESSTGDYIESDKPVLVAQYMSSQGNCGVVGNTDPEMFYLSPVQQAIKKTQFYRNNRTAITKNFITLVIPTEGLSTLKIDNVNYLAYPATDRYVYDHPNLSGYSVVTKRWDAGEGTSLVESDLPFTGVVYGLGSVESYGYNIGTLVKNLNNLSSINTSYNTGANPTGYTCKGAPFTVTVLLPIQPTSIKWEFSKVAKLTPNVDSLQTNPVSIGTRVVDGVTYYAYTVKKDFVLDTVGFINIPVQYSSPLIEKCSNTENGVVVVQILPAPKTDFSIALPGGGTEACAGAVATFTGDLITANGIALSEWQWTFPGNSTASGRVQPFTFANSGTFPVKLRGITADGCMSDTTKNVVINPRPGVTITNDSLPTCPGTQVTFTINNPETGITYNWYNAATGGTQVSTGTSFTPPAATVLPATFYVEGVTGKLCATAVRKKVTVYAVTALAKPVVTATSTPISITFTWTAVNGVSGYEVSVDGGTTFVTPSSGTTGLTHKIEGLTPSTEVTLIVRATGIVTCQTSLSDAVTGRTLLETVFVANAFTPNGDGKNDEFKIYGYTIKEMKFVVFNQWGQKVAETVNPAMDATGGHIVWDGRFKGEMLASGVYTYVAQIVLINGKTENRKGAINLIR